MLRTRFFQDALTFRHVLDSVGCTTFAEFLLKHCNHTAPYESALSLNCRDGSQDRIFYNQGLAKTIVGMDSDTVSLEFARRDAPNGFSYYETSDSAVISKKFPLSYCFDTLVDADDLSGTIQMAWNSLDPGGVFAYVGYLGPKSGPDAKDMTAILSLLSAVPSSLLVHPNGVSEEFIRLFLDEISPRHAGGTVEAALENQFGQIKTIQIGSLFTYLLWRCTFGKISYEKDANIALILMAQTIEQRLIAERIIQPTLKLVVARKRNQI